jgi:hypothetical protein
MLWRGFTCQPASEADLHSMADRTDSSLCKVPHEAVNECSASKLSRFAVSPVSQGSLNGLKAASEADLQMADRKKSAVRTENLLSAITHSDSRPMAPSRPCFHCGIRDWQWDNLLDNYTCGVCNHG